MITAHPSAPPGSVTTLTTLPDFPIDCAILCRNNAPLTTLALTLIKRNVPVRILGRDFGAGLSAVVEKLRDISAVAIAEWAGRQRPRNDRARALLEDKVLALRALARDATGKPDLLAKIDRLFVATGVPGAITLATGHKAKGLEWNHVFILDRHLIPSKWSETPAERLQERNLLYVMVTRAKTNLTYIQSK